MKRNYIEIRKVAWDELWHAVFQKESGEISWDRVNQQEAIELSGSLSGMEKPQELPSFLKTSSFLKM